MNTSMHQRHYANGSVGFALQILFALLLLAALSGQALAANCTATYTNTSTGGSTNYTLTAGQSLKIASGTYTGTVEFGSGSTICVETGATFTPGNLNNPAGTLSNYGTANLGTFAYNAGTVIDNYGTLSFTGLNTNGATTFYNRANATMSAPTFQLGSNSTLTNDGLMTATGDLNTTLGTTLTNNYRIEVNGNFNPDGTFTNNGRAYAKNFINMNSSATIINNCTLVSYNGFNSNNPNVTNNGTILITQPNNKWQHNASGVFHNGPNAKVAGYDFINNSTITGSGAFIFSGSTTNQGAFTGNSSSDKINFYDETQTGSQFFDFQNTAPTNTVRTAFTRPTELDSPTTCSAGYKSFALAGTTGTITGTVYTDSNLSNALDATETKLPNITVWLYDSAGTTLLQSMVTDASGAYSFTGVAAGTYQLKVDSADIDRPAGATIGTTNPLTAVAVTVGGTTANQNFGFDLGAYCPVAGQSISNVSGNALTVKSSSGTISSPNSALGALTAANTTTTTTNSAKIPSTAGAQITLDLGQTIPANASLVLSLAQDTSTSKVDIQFSADNTTFTSVGTYGVGGTLGSSATLDKLARITITVPASGVQYVRFLRQASLFWIDGVSYSQICVAPGTVSGTVYNDTNLSNALDATETKLPNITVWLYDSTGTSLQQTKTTDASGAYSFTGVAAGTYQLKVDNTDIDLPAGVTIGTTNPLTGVAVTAGGTTANQNFGFDPAAATAIVSGTVYTDSNLNNALDASETKLPNISVWLYNSAGTTLLQTKTTDASGAYSFTGVAAGTYQVKVDNSDPDRPAGTSIGTTNPLTGVVVTAGGTTANQNFGFDVAVPACAAPAPTTTGIEGSVTWNHNPFAPVSETVGGHLKPLIVAHFPLLVASATDEVASGLTTGPTDWERYVETASVPATLPEAISGNQYLQYSFTTQATLSSAHIIYGVALSTLGPLNTWNHSGKYKVHIQIDDNAAFSSPTIVQKMLQIDEDNPTTGGDVSEGPLYSSDFYISHYDFDAPVTVEANKTYYLRFYLYDDAKAGVANSIANRIIFDDLLIKTHDCDALPTTRLSVTNAVVTEGNSGTTNLNFAVNLSNAAPTGGVSFSYATADDTATLANNDYQTKTGTVTIPADASSAVISVPVVGDTTIESNEKVTLNITNLVNAQFQDSPPPHGVIIDDDAAVACNVGSGHFGGIAFQDYNQNGIREAGEIGLSSVTVTAYNSSNASAATATTNADGWYVLSGLTNGTAYRLEFTNLPAGVESASHGTDSKTNVQFVTANPTCSANVGISNPVDYCQADPKLLTARYVNGDSSATGADQSGTLGALLSFNYAEEGITPAVNQDALGSQVGGIWGLAYNRNTKKAFASAMVRRHVGLGPLGIGGIYAVNYSGATPTVSSFLNVDGLAGIDVGSIGTNSARGLAGDPYLPNYDATAFDKVGKEGLGDIELSDDGNTLYVTNLFSRKIIKIDLTAYNTSGTIPTTATEISLPAVTCTNGVARPFGLKYYRGKLHAGVTCTAESAGGTSNNLKASIHAYDGTSWTEKLQIPLNYAHWYAGDQHPSGSQLRTSIPWISTFNSFSLFSNQVGGMRFADDSQLLLSDIEFDTNGDMLVGFVDRTGLQLGVANYGTDTSSSEMFGVFSNGELLKASYNAATGAYTLENAGMANGVAGAGYVTDPSNPPWPYAGPGGGEFYGGEHFSGHSENSFGAIALVPGKQEVALNAMNPFGIITGGTIWLNNNTGERTRGTQLYGEENRFFGKAVGLGDIEVLCDPAPIEIGNRVWQDTDKDGLQDAGEAGIANVSTTLTCGTDSASATTDAQGEYYFSNKAGGNATFMGSGESCTLSVNNTQANLSTYTLTTQNADSKTDNNSKTDIRDSDAATSSGNAVISFTVGAAGQNNHSLDIGYQPPITTSTVSGKVFDDVNYGGDAGRAFGTAGTANVSGARVELYNSTGAFVSTTTSAADGTYSFTNVSSGNYFVRVVNDTVKSTRSGSNATERGIQTYRTDGTTAVTSEVGGRKPAVADASANTTSQTLNTTTFVLSGGGQAQSVQPITVAGINISGANFGFNFSTVVNTNDSGQGSLRQGITNINLLANTGLAQTGQDNTYGVDTSVIKEVLLFNIPAASDPLGRADICGGTSCKITISSQLPAVAIAPAIIDATTQPGYVAGTPGVPRIQIVPAAGLDARGFTMGYDAPDSTLRGLSITGFRNLATNRGLTVDSERTIIESNYIGVTPAGTADGNGNGIELQYTQSAVIGGTTSAKRNIISANKAVGLFFNTGASGSTIQNNFIGTNPAGTAAMSNETIGIDTEGGSGTKILDNVISGNWGDGIQLGFTSGGPGVANAIIQGNRIGVGINGEAIGNNGPGIMNYGASNGHQIGGTGAGQSNIIAYNLTGGIKMANNSSSAVVISGNSIYANGNLGIDLGNNGVTVNDSGDTDSGANDLLNFPILSQLSISGSNLTITGCSPAGATVELFEADVSVGGKAIPGDNKQGKTKDYGEGQTYLTSFVEGSASDTDSANCTLATDADGNNQTGMKAFSVTISKPASVATGDTLTTTATLAASGTSEFSPTMTIAVPTSIAGTVFEDMNYGGGIGRAFGTAGTAGVNGATVELYNSTGTFITTTSTAADGSYTFNGIAAGNYYVRVVNDTIKSTRTGSNGTERGIQTYRTDGTTAVSNEVGGRKPASVDAAANTTSQTLNTATLLLSGGGQAQSVQPVTVAGSNITGANFGFNFSTVVNTNDSGQGSLRQGITNANLLTNTGMAQPGSTYGFDTTLSKEVLVFNIPASGDPLGRADSCGGATCTITVSTKLPNITAPLILDGTTQPGYVAGTPGVPRIQIKPIAGLTATGIEVHQQANDSTVRGLSLTGFGVNLTNTALSIWPSRVVVESNYIGVAPDGTVSGNGVAIELSSGGGAPSTKIRIGGTTADKRNIISGFSYLGISMGYSKSEITVQNNFIGTNPAGTASMTTGQGEGIHVGTSSGVNILDNVISGMAQFAAISINDDGAPYGYEAPLLPIIIQGNRIGVGINGENIGNAKEGILNVGTPDPVQIGGTAAGQANTIAYNALGGVLYTNLSNQSVNTISRNSIYANGRLGIDLGRNLVTLNDANDADTGANDLLNFPMLSKLTSASGNLTITGCAPAGASVELFEADVSVGGKATPGDNKQGKSKDYGEGQTYLANFVEGSAADTDTADCALTADADGNVQTSMKAFTVTIPNPAGFVIGDTMTATASIATSGTSEFSPTIVLLEVRDIAGKVFEDLNYGGGAGRAFNALDMQGVVGATVELYNASNTLIDTTTTTTGGAYSFTEIPVGSYSVKVVSDTVSSTRPGSDSSELGVITYRTDGITPVTTVGAQAVQNITLAATSLSNVSFGFNFDTVSNTNDSGAGSLRQFILNANLLGGDSSLAQQGRTAGTENAILMLTTADTNYVASGTYWSIPLQSALPAITAPIVLDGSMLVGSSNNPVLELKGTSAGAGSNGLTLNSGSTASTIRKLAVNGFSGTGIYLNGGNGNTLQANYIGVTPAGASRTNTGAAILLNATSNNLIGGTASGTGNWLANNGGDGIAITAATSLANTILGNSIHNNGGLGIDLADNDVTANDVSDSDSGPNNLLNFPEVQTNSFGANGTKIVTYDFNLDVPAGDYRLELFTSVAKDDSGNGEGQTFIGSKDITHPGTGSLNFKGTLNATITVTKGTFISATLTQKTGATTFGATSEFSGIKEGINTQVCEDLINGTGADMVIDETTPTTIIKLLQAFDYSNTPPTPITYVISGGTDGNMFTITNPTAGATLPCATLKFVTNDVVITKAASTATDAETRATSIPPGNYELPMDKDKNNVYDLQITATDSTGKKYVRDLSVQVMNTNEAPVITSAAAASFSEDSSANVLDIASQDPDAGTVEGNGLTYRISGGIDASQFEVAPATGILKFRAAPDYDAPMDANRDNLYEVEVMVTDTGGLSASKLFKVSIVNNAADDGVLINVKALLQGAYDSKTALMSADLNTLGVLPSKQPYKATPFSYAGAETLSAMLQETTGDNAAVDWVLVDLRTSPTSIVASRAVMLQRDGDLVDAQTGSADLHFANVKAGNYYVSVRHRNHLGIISASPLSLSHTAKLINFTASSTAVKGEEARLTAGTLAMMWAGDINGSNTLTANGPGNDVTSLLSGVITSTDNLQGNTNHILSGYLATDLNMDGKTLFTGPGNDTSLLVGNIILHPLNTGYAGNYIVKGGL